MGTIVALEDRQMPPDAVIAFDYYRSEGERSHVKTADALGHPIGTVKWWAATFRWAQRARALDTEVHALSRDAADAYLHAKRMKALRFLDAVMDDVAAPMRERRAAAQALLDRAGYAPSHTTLPQAASDTAPHYSDAELAALAQTPEGVQTLLKLSRRTSTG